MIKRTPYFISFLSLIFLTLTVSTQAQILNVESLRRVSDTSKWSGNISFSLNLTKNTSRIFSINNGIHTQYLYKKNLVLFVNKITAKRLNNTRLVNKGTQHLRYNYRPTKRFALEAFVQSQYDMISAIDFRGLIGIGPRFKLFKSEQYKFYVGVLSMYEYEKTSDKFEGKINKDYRNSTYLSFSLFPKENISIVSTTYYQPRYNKFNDFRISNDTAIAIKLLKNLAFKVNFTYLYDAIPVSSIPKEQYKITNGIVYTFD